MFLRWGGGSGPWLEDWKSRVTRQLAMTFFAACWGVCAFGVVWHFVANEAARDGFARMPGRVDAVVEDTQRLSLFVPSLFLSRLADGG